LRRRALGLAYGSLERPSACRVHASGRARLIAGALALHIALVGCAGTAPEIRRDSAQHFLCDGGTTFRVDFSDGQVRVTTNAAAYALGVRPSSIGSRYSSGVTTFILDQDRAVLTGAEGGPFRHCHGV